jgi:hypothetical protein
MENNLALKLIAALRKSAKCEPLPVGNWKMGVLLGIMGSLHGTLG